MDEENNSQNGLDFKLNSDKSKLFAVVTPCTDKIELSIQMLKARLVERDLASLFINDHALLDLVERYNHTSGEKFQIEIGERRDASCELRISADRMQAFMSLTPSFGGLPITLSDIQKLLQDEGIVWGIVPVEEIEGAIEKADVVDFVVAHGLEPEDGIDTQFVNLVPAEPKERKPMVDEDGSVDYRELGDIVVVHKNEVLMTRVPPVPGKKGRNILGEVVPPEGGADIPFCGDKKGVCINPDNENQLISTITGQPVLVPHGIVVLPVLTVKNVDFASGNIRFDGSVVVSGDVKEGMTVYALEDITVEGSVVDARLECMGNLVINGCVTGGSQLIANGDVMVKGGVEGFHDGVDLDQAEDDKAKIASRGSVNVGFAENFIIEAGVDIVIDKYALSSHLMAGNKISIGAKNSGKKSSIIGGVTWAMMMVKASIIGATSGIKTHVQVGSNPYIQKRISTIKNALAPIEKNQKGVEKILSFMDANPAKKNPETLEKLNHTLSKLTIEADAYHEELRELSKHLTVIDNAKIVADRGVYVGTLIQINSVQWKALENRGKSVFTLLKREICINSR